MKYRIVSFYQKQPEVTVIGQVVHIASDVRVAWVSYIDGGEQEISIKSPFEVVKYDDDTFWVQPKQEDEMKDFVALVLFKDWAFKIFSQPAMVRKDRFQKGAKFFKMDDSTQVIDICEWISDMYRDTKKIKEYTPEG